MLSWSTIWYSSMPSCYQSDGRVRHRRRPTIRPRTLLNWCSPTNHHGFITYLVLAIILFNIDLSSCENGHLKPNNGQQHRFLKDPSKGQGAVMTLTYKDPSSGLRRNEDNNGVFGIGSAVKHITGQIIHVRSGNNSFGCHTIDNPPGHKVKSWVALLMRGGCEFSDKIRVATKYNNASATVIYDQKNGPRINGMEIDSDVQSKVSVLISWKEGDRIASLVDNGTKVYVEIQPAPTTPQAQNISRTSILFVSISFIVLMIISLTWLIFYYIQRFRYAHAKERLTKRLANAAKKTIAKIPQRTIKTGDKELESDHDQCAVCIEGYKPSDVIRILPCKHILHKSCVDPWLLEQRSCPMCKMDILRAYGMPVNGSQESVNQAVEVESMTTSGGLMDDADPEVADENLDESIVRLQSNSAHFRTSPIEVESNIEASECLIKPSTSAMVPASSFESVHSIDSECNEFQSLMLKPTSSSKARDSDA